MNDFKLLPDDQKLTAYALGELEGDERAAVEHALSKNPAARASVEEIRAMATELETVFEKEPSEAESAMRAMEDPYGPAARRKAERFPKVFYLIGGLAAACLAAVVALQDRPVRNAPQKTYHEFVFPPVQPSLAETKAAIEGGDEAGVFASAAPTNAMVAVPAVSGEPSVIGKTPTGLLEQSQQRLAMIPRAADGLFDSRSWPVFSYKYDEQPTRMVGARRPFRRVTSARYVAPAGATRVDVTAANVPVEGLASTGTSIVFPARFRMMTTFAERGSTARMNTESYAYRPESEFLVASRHPLSTFSVDVDTASYANVRRFIRNGRLPPIDAVRIEEMLNYFPYDYVARSSDEESANPAPFAATMEVAEAPWAPGHRLVRIGLKARDVSVAQRGPANLVFLLDVSGSMNAPNKLPLVKESLRLLLARLRADDRIAIVTYAGVSGLALPSTPVAKAQEIEAALDELNSSGSTNGAMGIHLAYDIAKANLVSGGVNRVILCTDGDFNVGVTDDGSLVRLIEEKAKTGVSLTVLGFGMGNLKDATMQQLADRGNGNYGYVDSRREAEKLLVEQVSGTLVTVAKDVKLQVEFNPAKVASYRLIGYEKRLLKQEDFNNDAVDAGEIGAGHTVTALYEIVPVGMINAAGNAGGSEAVDELKYARVEAKSLELRAESREGQQGKHDGGVASPKSEEDYAGELLTLKVRYKEPAGDVSKKLEFALVDGGLEFAAASDDFKFAAAVAGFGMILRDSPHKGMATHAAVKRWAEAGSANDAGGYRAEFIDLVGRAEAL